MKNLHRSTLGIYFLCFTLCGQAQDTVYENPNGSNIDTRSFPTNPSFTVLSAPAGGAGSNFYLLAGPKSSILYPNGLTINSGGAGLFFVRQNINIANYLTIDDANIGTGLVTINSKIGTKISGDVHLVNSGQLKLITHNTKSSTTRLYTDDAYFNLDSGTKLHVEFKLDSSTGRYISFGAIEGSGDIALTNVGANKSGLIVVQNKNGQDYTYNGNISYENQRLPDLIKNGSGHFTFTGDVNKAEGDSLGFTDGFGFVEVNAGELQLSSEAFVFGTRTTINGGSLIFDQSTDADIPGARFEGTGGLIKRGSGTITLHGITNNYSGDLKIEDGTLGLAGDATLGNASSVSVNAGSTLDISNVYTRTSVSRLYGNGNVELGTKTLNKIIQLSPGNRSNGIGTLSVTGSGTLDLSGTKLSINMDPTQGAGDLAGVTHDQLQVSSSVQAGTLPLISLVDNQAASSPSAFVGGREFTVVTAGSGLSMLSPADIVEDATSFHAFIGADPETTVVSDSEIRVRFGIKTANQVVAAVGQNQGGGTPSSTPNKTNATAQHIGQSLGVTGNQRPTIQQLQSSAWQGVTTDTLTQAAGNNNPEAYSSNLTLGLEGADLMAMMVRDQIRPRVNRPVDPKAPILEDRLWVDTAYVKGSVDGTDSLTGNFDYHLAGVAVGTNLYRSQSTRLGAYLGGIFSELKEHDHIDQNFDNNYVYTGLYSQFDLGDDVYLNALLSFFYGDHETDRRNLDIRGGSGTISSSSFDSYGGSIGIEFEKLYEIGKLGSAIPSIGFLYSALEQDSILESGGGRAYDYQIQRADAHAAVFSAGVDLIRQFNLSQGLLTGKLRLNYEYDAFADRNSEHDIAASLVGQPVAGFVGQNRGPHGFHAGVGCQWDASSQVSIGGGYLYSLRSAGHENSFGLNCTIRW
jgi:autotransporter-associated beta strand protein